MWQMAVVPRWPDVLVVVVVVTAKFSVSEGVSLPQCVNGCFYMEDYHVIQIRCEELAVGEEVAWTIVYQDNNPEYSGKCNEPNRPGLCAPSGNGFTPTVQQSGDVSVLTIDLKSFRPNLNYHTLTCESGGQRAVCTIRYTPCSFTRLTSTSAPVLVKRTDSRMTDVTVPSDGPHIAAAVAGGLLGVLVIAAVFVITIVCYKKRASPEVNPPSSPSEVVTTTLQQDETDHHYATPSFPERHTVPDRTRQYQMHTQNHHTRQHQAPTYDHLNRQFIFSGAPWVSEGITV